MKSRTAGIAYKFLRTAPALALIAGFAIFSGTALGTTPIRFHDHFTASVPANVCGISVDLNIVATDNYFYYSDGTFKNTYSFSQTLTNPVNGKAVIVSGAGQITGQAVVNQQANTITFITSYKGIPERIQTANGPVLTRDAGIITFTSTFDLTSGDFISSTTTANGPHPESDSNFALFCDVVTPALT